MGRHGNRTGRPNRAGDVVADETAENYYFARDCTRYGPLLYAFVNTIYFMFPRISYRSLSYRTPIDDSGGNLTIASARGKQAADYRGCSSESGRVARVARFVKTQLKCLGLEYI